jgi:hypothetical protein
MDYGMVKPVPIMFGEASGESPFGWACLVDAPHIVKPLPIMLGEGAMQSHSVKLRNAPNIMDMGERR